MGGVFRIGDQRLGIETDVPVLDDEGQPTYADFGEPIVTRVKVWVDRSHFELQMPSEQQNLTVTTSEIAWAFMEIADGVVAAVDDDDNPAPIQFFGLDGLPTISSSVWLWHDGLRYAMRGDARLHRGPIEHIECICEREQG